ncbi:MAG: hypothetical protein BGP06_03690 [Rhizobiales bacterium 65-9]|nr:VOC family protein [Hyphomicrobiales bacterium]OJY36033.1 MAG: hypothetical protein BGP06_03690 [Rhizobiales bacterium 65-9]
MSFLLDHLVIAVAELDQAVADYRALGFTVSPGGEHQGGVSHNALIVFRDGSYIELIAFRRTAPENRWWTTLTGAGEGFVDFAFLPQDVGRDIGVVRARGLAMEGPAPGGRARPDGVRLDWLTAQPPTTDLPFWCGDVTPRSLRVPEGALRVHPNGAQGVLRLRILVKDVAVSATRYIALLGPHSVAAREGAATVTVGDVVLELSEPRDAAEKMSLHTRGEGLVAVTLRGSRSQEFDAQRAHGANILMIAS